jgi:hypothetical protein
MIEFLLQNIVFRMFSSFFRFFYFPLRNLEIKNIFFCFFYPKAFNKSFKC